MTAKDLWASAPFGHATFDSKVLDALPVAAQRYLSHAIKPGAVIGSGVLLEMHGEIRFGAWTPYKAQEAIVSGRGMRWEAKSRLKGLPVSGFEEIVDGVGHIQWKLLGEYTIPSKLRLGWHFGTERFDVEGEFFRANIDSAEYR